MNVCGSDTRMKAASDLRDPIRTDMEIQNQLLDQRLPFPETLENEFSGDDTLKGVENEIPMESDQRVIIKFLFNERHDANQILERLEAQFQEDAYSLRSVQFWIGEMKRGRKDLRDGQRSGRRPIDSLTAHIKVLLDENCFMSARSIAETLQVSHSTVLMPLREDLGFQSFHLRWIQWVRGWASGRKYHHTLIVSQI
jgi:hypothetical protein